MTNKKSPLGTIQLPIQTAPSSKANAAKKKSGRGRTRAAVLVLVHVVIIAHITHYGLTGRSLSPAEPSESMYTLELGQVNTGAVFFLTAIVSTAIFGRFFCGWACHLVALQDLSAHLLRRIGFRPKPLRSRLLALVPFGLAFYMFVWPTLNRLINGKPHPGFSNHLMTENFWYTFPGPWVTAMTFVVCGGAIIYLLGNKGFCTYACPYGAFFSVSDRLAFGRIRVTDACQHCGQCTAHCTSNVQIHSEVKNFGMVVDPGCMKCMDCVSVCPNDALYYSLRNGESSKDEIRQPNLKGSAKRKSYDFTILEELLGLAIVLFTIYSVRGLYDIAPLLLSVAVGAITGLIALRIVRAVRKPDQRIQNVSLKRKNRFTRSGLITLFSFSLWLAFLMHSSYVQYHRFRGRDYLSRVSAPWEDLITGSALQNFSERDLEIIGEALRSYRITDNYGFRDVLEVKLGQAIGNMMKGDLEAAEPFLRQAYQMDKLNVGDMLTEFLISQDRQSEAAELL